jgi:hypothetical protein
LCRRAPEPFAIRCAIRFDHDAIAGSAKQSGRQQRTRGIAERLAVRVATRPGTATASPPAASVATAESSHVMDGEACGSAVIPDLDH